MKKSDEEKSDESPTASNLNTANETKLTKAIPNQVAIKIWPSG
jgi:hypothetical protein